MTTMLKIDPAHEAMDLFDQAVTQHVWKKKYRFGEEVHPYDSFARSVDYVYQNDSEGSHQDDAFLAQKLGLWNPGGRIHAGAGTGRLVTLMNCYVNMKMHDSMSGIADALKVCMLTLQQGGGIGTDFSELRPKKALLKATGSDASGPISFMHMWDAMSATIKSAGERRGAMMGTMCDTHPDLFDFIDAKKKAGALTSFNLSILISDKFMAAVSSDLEWSLYFKEPPADGSHMGEFHNPQAEGPTLQYVYSRHRARDIWNKILESTYTYAEPGVIFIDRINKMNNLGYCEDIRCTNPCGEQPLPPHGTCNLGAVNLARMVKDPFGDDPRFDERLLRKVVQIGVRYLDNVIDVTNYPLPEQEQEQQNKRRLGLGVTGLADCLAQLKLVYGSNRAQDFTSNIIRTIRNTAYRTSIMLAKENGSFPLFDREKFLESPFIKELPVEIRTGIQSIGIRNGVLMTIAPTGTTSLYYGDCSNGIEPVYSYEAVRNIVTDDGGKTTPHTSYNYGYRLYHQVMDKEIGSIDLPDYMVTAENIAVQDHVRMQAAAQKYVDASISKTINCAESLPYEDFKEVYDLAYKLGCKGCTTYRPSKIGLEIRGAFIESPSMGIETPKKDTRVIKATIIDDLPKRESALSGTTYKFQWPNMESAMYVTINNYEGKPYEIFISSINGKYADWSIGLTRMISSIMRQGINISFIPEELGRIRSTHDSAFIDGKYYGSIVAYIGSIIQRHIDSLDDGLKGLSIHTETVIENIPESDTTAKGISLGSGNTCPMCQYPTFRRESGCGTCYNCNYSTCE